MKNNIRLGLGKNRGSGYYNIVPKDPYIHSLSAKGIKTKLCPCKAVKKTFGLKAVNLNKEISQDEKIRLDIKEIAKEVKDQLKKDYPNSKFSVRIERYAGGQSLTIDLLETDIKVVRDFKDIPETVFDWQKGRNEWKTMEQIKQSIKETQESGYHQLHFSANEEYDPNRWNNGVFLTKEGFDMLKKANDYAQHFNWDNSDVQTDYFDVNFYVHLNLGSSKSEKPLIQQGKQLKGYEWSKVN